MLSGGCGRGRPYLVANGARVMPSETQRPCRDSSGTCVPHARGPLGPGHTTRHCLGILEQHWAKAGGREGGGGPVVSTAT